MRVSDGAIDFAGEDEGYISRIAYKEVRVVGSS